MSRTGTGNRNAMGELATPPQNKVVGGRKHNVAGGGEVTSRAGASVRPADARHAQSDGLTLGQYKHTPMNAYYTGKTQQRPASGTKSRKGQRSC